MNNWHDKAHTLWNHGLKSEAIDCLLKDLNAHQRPKPKALMMQFSYYLFLLADYQSSAKVLEEACQFYPDDDEIAANWVAMLSRTGDHNKAVSAGERALVLNPNNVVVLDALANCYSKLGEAEKAIETGNKSLFLKDALPKEYDDQWEPPRALINATTKDKKRVIAFSLWGNQEAYINGAIRNLLLANDLYAGWEIWIYHDTSVDQNKLALLADLGAKLIKQTDGQSEKNKLCWRFQVANHTEVGYFLVRDIDSVFSVRERLAVQEWLDSGLWFHTINDWWTHTDLVLGGLWGGVAGVLPNVWQSVLDYSPKALATPNIDQWFLRDRVWPYIKQSCCIHDRFYRPQFARPIPGPAPVGNQHIGCCEFAQQPEKQRKLVQPWLNEFNNSG